MWVRTMDRYLRPTRYYHRSARAHAESGDCGRCRSTQVVKVVFDAGDNGHTRSKTPTCVPAAGTAMSNPRSMHTRPHKVSRLAHKRTLQWERASYQRIEGGAGAPSGSRFQFDTVIMISPQGHPEFHGSLSRAQRSSQYVNFPCIVESCLHLLTPAGDRLFRVL